MKRFIAILLLLGCFPPFVLSAQSDQTNPVVIALDEINGFMRLFNVGNQEGIVEPLQELDAEGGTIRVYLRSTPPSGTDDIIRQAIDPQKYPWLKYEGSGFHGVHQGNNLMRLDYLEFRFAANTTPHSRIVVLTCTTGADINDYYSYRTVSIHQPGNTGLVLQRFSLSSPIINSTYPGQRYTIKLSGSEPGVEYTLMRFDEDVARLPGTGRQLEFTGDWGAGVFTVVANKESATRIMDGNLEIPWYLLVQDGVGRIRSDSGTSVVLPPEGGQAEIGFFFEHIFNQSQVATEGSYMVDSWMAGENEKWHSDFRLTNRRGTTGMIYLTLTAGPNNTDSTKTGILSVGFDSEGVSRNLYVVQEPRAEVAPLTRYKLSVVKYTGQAASGAPTDLHLSGSQEGVTYKLYSNGAQIDTKVGTGSPIAFWNVTHTGPFTAKAFKGTQVADMYAPWGSTTRGNAKSVSETIHNQSSQYYGSGIHNTTNFDGLGRTIRESTYSWAFFEDKEEWLGYDYNSFMDLLWHSGDADGRWQAVEEWNQQNDYSNILITEYDTAGRPNKKYLSSNFLNMAGDQLDDYGSTPGYLGEPLDPNRRGYAKVEYDNTPQSRVIREIPEGFLEESYTANAPNAREKVAYEYTYAKNTSADAVKRFVLQGTSVALSGIYPAGSLQKKAVEGPHGQTGAEFRNQEGLLIASRESTDHFTHYVYDDLGRLRYVIPPLMDIDFTSGTKTRTQLDPLCYWYEYDEDGRVYRKHIPGAGVTTYLYNKRGQPVLYQDAKMATVGTGQWVFTKYDVHGRVVYTGTCGGTEQAHRQALADQQIFYETAEYDTVPDENNPTNTSLHGYSNTVYPTTITANSLLTIYYYDNYDWTHYGCHPFQGAQALGKGRSWSTRGIQTGIKERVLGQSGSIEPWVATTYYYDTEGRLVQKISDMGIPGQQVESFLYDANGNVIQSRTRQQQSYPNPFTILSYDRFYKYNTAGKLHRIEQQIAGDEENGKVTLATYWYDYRGDLSHKWLHGVWDTVKYTRGIDRAVTAVKSSSFEYELKHDNALTPRYDGNIGEIVNRDCYGNWNSHYTYDNLGRLKTFSRDGGRSASYSYDRNGNLASLYRYLDWNRQDDLSLVYGVGSNGNALRSMTKNGRAITGYTYDANGNMTRDADRGINITYNILNLPDQVGNARYSYTSTGRKLQVYEGTSTTNYVGEAVYSNYSPVSLSNPEGESRFTRSRWSTIGFDVDYRYFYKDHLGSVCFVSGPPYYYGPGVDWTIDRWGDNRWDLNIDYQRSIYFPFGQNTWEDNLTENKRLFTGKELQNTRIGNDLLRLYDFGARYYDPVVARWTSIDPLAEKYYSQSPYNYVGNNPVSRIDPDGRDWYQSDDMMAIVWKDKDDKEIEIDGQTYYNIGRYYSIYIGDGEYVHLYQNAPVLIGGWINNVESYIVQKESLFGSLINLYDNRLSDLSKENLFLAYQNRYSAEAAGIIFGKIIAPMVGTGIGAGTLSNISLSSIKSSIQMVMKSKPSDWVRYGKTVVSNQLVNGSGATGATVVNGLKGGGKLASTGQSMGFHYHIHRYNWYKPWTWFNNTPIIKP